MMVRLASQKLSGGGGAPSQRLFFFARFFPVSLPAALALPEPQPQPLQLQEPEKASAAQPPQRRRAPRRPPTPRAPFFCLSRPKKKSEARGTRTTTRSVSLQELRPFAAALPPLPPCSALREPRRRRDGARGGCKGRSWRGKEGESEKVRESERDRREK